MNLSTSKIILIIISLFAIVFLFDFLSPRVTTEEFQYFIGKWEGKRNTVYFDSFGNKTVGIGHLVKNGEVTKSYYSEAAINKLFIQDLENAQKDAIRIYGDLGDYPKDVELILVDLSFNLGYTKLAKFVKFNQFIVNKNYQAASRELQNSLWYRQVGLRGINHVNSLGKIK